jgi:hypothetical protein
MAVEGRHDQQAASYVDVGMTIWHMVTNRRRRDAFRTGDFELDPFSHFAKSLVAWVPLNTKGDGDEKVLDYSHYRNHATREPLTTDMTVAEERVPGWGAVRVLKSDGGDGRVELPDADHIDLENDDLTVMSWIRYYANPGIYDGVWSKSINWGSGWGQYVVNPKFYMWVKTGSGSSRADFDLDQSDRDWHHVCMSYRGNVDNVGGPQAYLDGALGATEGSYTGSIGTNTNNLQIGRQDHSGLYASPAFQCDFRLYNRGLIDLEVKEACRHPWLICRPRTGTMYSFPEAGGGGCAAGYYYNMAAQGGHLAG